MSSIEPEGRASPDVLLTLLRLRIDLNRLRGKSVAALAHASLSIAEAMGDDLFAALALVDLMFSESERLRTQARARLEGVSQRFERVGKLLEECRTIPASTSARTLKKSLDAVEFGYEADLFEKKKSVLFTGLNILFILENLEVRSINLQDRSRALLECASKRGCDRADLFTRVWRIGFRSDQHDVILRNALLRARKQSGCELVSLDGRVFVPNTVVVKM